MSTSDQSPALVDVLMITHNFPEYVQKSIPNLLAACDEYTRIWLWHNGDDEETLETVRPFTTDDRVYKFHHSRENVRLTEPTNWAWTGATGGLVGKVDDDCLLPTDWITKLRAVHAVNSQFGAIACSLIPPQERDAELIAAKTETFDGGVQLFRNHWVQGSGYLLNRDWIASNGPLKPDQSWTEYGLEIALAGAINGFALPLIFVDHMDDPRSENTGLHTVEDLQRRAPLSLTRNRIETLEDWQRRIERSSRGVQTAPLDLRYWKSWRRRVRNIKSRIMKYRRP